MLKSVGQGEGGIFIGGGKLESEGIQGNGAPGRRVEAAGETCGLGRGRGLETRAQPSFKDMGGRHPVGGVLQSS